MLLTQCREGYNVGVLDACGVEIKLLGTVPVRSGMFADPTVKVGAFCSGICRHRGHPAKLHRVYNISFSQQKTIP